MFYYQQLTATYNFIFSNESHQQLVFTPSGSTLICLSKARPKRTSHSHLKRQFSFSISWRICRGSRKSSAVEGSKPSRWIYVWHDVSGSKASKGLENNSWKLGWSMRETLRKGLLETQTTSQTMKWNLPSSTILSSFSSSLALKLHTNQWKTKTTQQHWSGPQILERAWSEPTYAILDWFQSFQNISYMEIHFQKRTELINKNQKIH